MHGTLLSAVIHPDNTPHGYVLTFAFPVLMFVIVSGFLFVRFRSPHRVPGHVELSASRWADAQPKTTEADQAGSGASGTEGSE